MAEGQADNPTYTQREFFRTTLANHDKVSDIDTIDDQLYRIERTGGLQEVIVYITNLYTVGYAELLNIHSKCKDLNCVVTMSNWNSYTKDARMYGRENHIGLLKFADFMGALNLRAIWKYDRSEETRAQRGRYK